MPAANTLLNRLMTAAIVAAGLALFVPITEGADTPTPAPAARTIFLVRHGAYVPDAPDSSQDPGLSPIGIAQAKLVAARLAGMPGKFDAIYSSPLARAHETAKVIAAELPGVPFEVLPELAECTPATRRKEITSDEKPDAAAACSAKLDALFTQRFVPARGAERREIFVCHGNVTRYLVTRALDVNPQAWVEMSVGHASLTVIRVEPDGRMKVVSVGDIGHLPPDLQTGATGMTEKSLTVPK